MLFFKTDKNDITEYIVLDKTFWLDGLKKYLDIFIFNLQCYQIRTSNGSSGDF